MGAPAGPLLGSFSATTASVDISGWMTWPGNTTVSLNQSLFWSDPGSNLSSTSSSNPKNTNKEKNWPALLILIIILLTIGGNILVIMAVSLEKKLQNATNFFLRSLAVADMLVGILVMPISLINVLYDYEWPLPHALCPIWIYLDVLFSTASIMHLCAISLDRYVAICNPIQHSRFNSRTKAMMKIAAVWTISIGISTPIPVIGLRSREKVFVNGSCMLNEERFVLVGSFVAFFIPLVIMVVTYCLTVQALQRQASVFLYEAKASSQQPLQPAVSSSSSSQLAPPPIPSRRSSLNCLRIGNSLSPATPDSISMVAGSEAPSQLSSPAVSHGRRGMMQAIKNERRASKVLGVVFFLFLVMWCPFFITNVLSVLCRDTCSENLLSDLLNVFVWVGYISSGVNPLVYTLFNKTYRRAFSRYMRCKYGGVRLRPVAINVPCQSQATVTPLLICVDVDRNSNCRNGDDNKLQKLELLDIDTHIGIEIQTGMSALSVNSCHTLAERTSSV
ncbi:5-hydroxytryptamine (serotonin) receptor 2C, G protein-coupled-like 1 isoform 1-T7 [Clarias gariepinus]|uniref:5-hydroxytryptamine (serotonin) receptor 2C, G protein-coupled-like 1 n=1 Tax=Clarias gariepinus TaxID=13013 RepID=UPI00234C5F95|nr:5-hydroxytryptamine (serotonin) receptor 2C, G protein-coupled-like 1 [Clarias gariepinus]XP_053352491.1 5-hydroxytryptamine (serotonin) receptor 2C, G protein-coupled-like 1 [Clarias gariepinus]XP_053352500.1 5-hydroxytryptamine (serotonin) receptor 2C, G protein-coupled-like 1 [Clarias gariepinus]XP_053352510.1 5-hydroxytryptamine (serotonin) receptor 2C, G protein-coupled-like 1 [Clarias gariepinus]XP_053352518.1 5-hydroxytryptamine (serotonin) receptor 2C, G protein-coupled-like 1 [Clari